MHLKLSIYLDNHDNNDEVTFFIILSRISMGKSTPPPPPIQNLFMEFCTTKLKKHGTSTFLAYVLGAPIARVSTAQYALWRHL